MLALPAAFLALALAQAPRPTPQVVLPPQPFTLELLDLKRGEWHFEDAFGQNLSLPGTVSAWAYPGGGIEGAELRYLCCDPEYPEDLAHATLKAAAHVPAEGAGRRFRIDEPYFSATIDALPPAGGASECRLSGVRFGPATAGDRYVAGLYLAVGGRNVPIWLSPGAEGASPVRLLTRRIGNVFTGTEPAIVTAAQLGTQKARAVALEVRDYLRGDVVWRGKVDVPAGAPGQSQVTIPIARYGIFRVVATSADGSAPAELRICRIPQPRKVDPDKSGFGMNLFQMQIWWYAHQVPLMAKAGVHWIRPWLAWENTWANHRPTPDAWETRPLDASLRRCEQLGLRYATILFAAPNWVSAGEPGPAPPPSKTDVWAKYVGDLAARFRGRIPYYEIWNEPDLMWQESTRHAGLHYVDLLKSGYAAIKRADPKAKVLGFSHAGYEQWLISVVNQGVGGYMDAATMHSYAEPDDFLAQVERRKDILRRGGLGNMPVWFNEFGTIANDFSPAYSREYNCSEKRQAEVLVENYAQALSISPGTKAFWFCTLDPRDPFHKDQFTGDAAIGVLYLGLLPKLAYAALAGAAYELDGRPCVGAARLEPGVRVVAFGGPVAVVWAEKALGRKVLPATAAGCGPSERIVVRDLLANRIAAGPAAGIRLDLTRGPLYIEGSRQLEAALRVQAAAQPGRSGVNLTPGKPETVRLSAPAKAAITVRTDSRLGIAASAARGAAGWSVVLAAKPGVERAHGPVAIAVRFPAGALGLTQPRTVTSEIWASVGAPNLVPDGGFRRGGTDAWTPERTSPYIRDAAMGHEEPGSLRLDGPFDRRLVYWGALPKAGQPLKLRLWVRTKDLAAARVTVSLALFGEKGWLRTWCLASTEPSKDIDSSWRVLPGCGTLPIGTLEWTGVEATLPAELLTAEVTKTAFLIDAAGGGSGSIWLDDFDLWQ